MTSTTNKKKSVKEQKTARVNAYLALAASINVHQAPAPTINNGIHGRGYEQAVKIAIGNYRFAGVAKPGAYDTSKKINGKTYTIEIKQGAGELARINAQGEIITTCLSSDFIIYTPCYIPNSDVTIQSYVLKTDDFIQGLLAVGMTRKKKSSYMCKQPKESQYHDRLTITSFSHRKNLEDKLWDCLEQYGTRLDKWIKENNIKV